MDEGNVATGEQLVFKPDVLYQILTARTSDLYVMCKSLGLSAIGSKEQLQQRLLQSVGKQATSLPTLEDSADSHIEAESNNDDDCSDAASVIDFSNPEEAHSRAVIFLGYMKEVLVKRARHLRLQGKVRNPLMLSKPALVESIVKSLLTEEFESVSVKNIDYITFECFCKYDLCHSRCCVYDTDSLW